MPVKRQLLPRSHNLAIALGFTLIELMVTIAIAGIVMGLAIPSFNTAIRNNRLTTLNNDFVTSLSIARSEAVKRGQVVTICKSANGTTCVIDVVSNWAQGWIVFTNANNNAVVDAGVDVVFRVQGPAQTQITMVGDNLGGTPATDVTSRINYGSNGMTVAAGGTPGVSGNILVCDNRRTEPVGKNIAINVVGRANTADRVVCGP
jgi:type IV fimbrial biogenesis protein FimT